MEIKEYPAIVEYTDSGMPGIIIEWDKAITMTVYRVKTPTKRKYIQTLAVGLRSVADRVAAIWFDTRGEAYNTKKITGFTAEQRRGKMF